MSLDKHESGDTEDICHTEQNFRIRTWGDIQNFLASISALVAVLFGGILWGLKLETGLSELRDKLESIKTERVVTETRLERANNELKAQLGQGILPITKERLDNVDQRISDNMRQLDKLSDQIDAFVRWRRSEDFIENGRKPARRP